MSSLRVHIGFKSFTYTIVIVNLVSGFLIKIHEKVKLITYLSFNKYSLKQLYYKQLDCFNTYIDNCSLIEYMAHSFKLVALGNLNPLDIYISKGFKLLASRIHINKL